MKTPTSASDNVPNVPVGNEQIISNPHYGKEYLTRFEALDSINMLSAILMADERTVAGERRRTG